MPHTALSWLFMLAAVFSLAVMVASPVLPQRSLAGTQMYLLLAVSGLLVAWHQSGDDAGTTPRRLRRALNACTLALALVFALSYGLMLRAYHQVAQQNTVRQQLIHEGMARGDVYIFIPKYHWLPLLRDESEHFNEFYPAGGRQGCQGGVPCLARHGQGGASGGDAWVALARDEFEALHYLGQGAGLVGEQGGGGRVFLHQGRVLLRHAIQLIDRVVDLRDAFALRHGRAADLIDHPRDALHRG
ncbi:DUF6056 family protein, partial [Leptospira sp. 96542]|nr:DUF6056 family protein [Leptospira sp. 96542]